MRSSSSPLADPIPFPDAFATLSTERLREAFAQAPDRIERALEGLPEDALLARPIAGKWSIQEIVFHVTDSECIGAIRVRQALGDDLARFPGYDENQWAARLRYASRTPELRRSVLRLFRAHRAVTAELFAAAMPEDWSREGIHAEWGVLTLRQLLELYADHGERHLAQILERRKLLGKPLELPLLLPQRLY